MRKIDPKQKILEIDGTPAKNSGFDLTLGFVLTYIMNLSKTCDALVAYRIILNCNKEKEFELTVDHTKIVKDEVSSFAKLENIGNAPRPFSNMVFGQILATLEGEDIGIVEKIEPVSKTENNGGNTTL